MSCQYLIFVYITIASSVLAAAQESINDPEFVAMVFRIAKASEMHNYMNESADPCENFYNFACGNWAKINPAASSAHLTTGLFETIAKALDRKTALLLKTTNDPMDTVIDKKVKMFYQSCTRLKATDYQLALREIIAEFGDMPALTENWDETKFDWLDTIGRIAYVYGILIIVGIDIIPDLRDNKINRVYISQQDFYLESRDMYVADETFPYRQSYMQKIESDLKQFLGMSRTLAKSIAKEILDFEVLMAHGMIDDHLIFDINDLYSLVSLDELQRRYAPVLDIERLANITLDGVSLRDETIYEYAIEFQEHLLSVIQQTPKRIIANYVFYKLTSYFMQKTSATASVQENACVEVTKTYFAKNLDNMIYRHFNTKQAERDVDLIWRKLKANFRETLQNVKWLQPSTRDIAVQKLDAMQLEISSYAKHNFTAEYGELEINETDFVENVRNIFKLSSRQKRAELFAPAKPIDAAQVLSYTPANVLLENTIRVPVALLQPYYLWAEFYPNAVKFGTLASLIAHELIHGFDDSGRKFDAQGNNQDWWDESSAKIFEARTACLIEQYSHYVYHGRYLPKSQSQSENIADNGGVRLAYEAYLKWYEAATENDLKMERLPRLNYTSKQLFFISYAQIWCEDVHQRLRNLQLSTDDHVPGIYRVIGPLSNYPEFAKEFNCAAGARMRRAKKCQIY